MKPKSKKLTPRQRRKEMTGINLEAINKRFEEYQQWFESLTLGQNEIYARLEKIEHGLKLLLGNPGKDKVIIIGTEAKKKAGKR